MQAWLFFSMSHNHIVISLGCRGTYWMLHLYPLCHYTPPPAWPWGPHFRPAAVNILPCAPVLTNLWRSHYLQYTGLTANQNSGYSGQLRCKTTGTLETLYTHSSLTIITSSTSPSTVIVSCGSRCIFLAFVIFMYLHLCIILTTIWICLLLLSSVFLSYSITSFLCGHNFFLWLHQCWEPEFLTFCSEQLLLVVQTDECCLLLITKCNKSIIALQPDIDATVGSVLHCS